MSSLRRKVGRVYRERGAANLARESAAYAFNQSRHRLRELAWRLRGERTFEVGGAETAFRVGSLAEARGLRYLADHEEPVLADLLTELGDDDVFFDVGANVGYYACFAAARLPADQVVAFEPYPPNVRRIHQNLALNDRDATVEALALSDEPGVASLDRGAMRPGYPFASLASDEAADTIEVDVETGDRLVERGTVPRPTVVKIDVEGAEPLVVDGLRETLSDERCRLVYCEVHRETDHRAQSVGDFGGSEADVVETLESFGFAVEAMADRRAELYLRARR